jgi:hypothetical protein
VPGQLYDVDPSRSSELARVEREVSGRDPKPFDAGLTTAVDLFQLDIVRPFESWVVLGRTGAGHASIAFEDLGLDPQRPFVVFEFWEKRFLGTHTHAFAAGPLPARFNAQAFIIRERQAHPQLLATSRHVTGGGPDLSDVAWRDGTLAGTSTVVAGDPYDIYVTEPAGWTFSGISCEGAGSSASAPERVGGSVKTGCRPAAAGTLRWVARFVSDSQPQGVR